jgi:hypothetical protein
MGSKFKPWYPRLEVIQVNEAYEARIPFDAQKSRERLKKIGSLSTGLYEIVEI